MNSLLYSIRGFKVGDPAFTFDYESKGFDRSVWSKVESSPESDIDENDPSQYFEFIANRDGSNVNFFGNSAVPERRGYYKVNGIRQDGAINALNFSSGDTVKICYGKNSFDTFICKKLNYLMSITSGRIPAIKSNNLSSCFENCYGLTSIPAGLFDNNPQATNFNGCFRSSGLTLIPEGLFDNCPNITEVVYCFNSTKITSIPEGLFDNCPNISGFNYCFQYCYDLTSIPEGLFDNCPNASWFMSCFDYCRSLTSIPVGLFDKNTQARFFDSCFEHCSSLIVNVQIGSTVSASFTVDNFANDTKEKGTVHCKEGSRAYTVFSESTTANVNVLTY